MKTGFVVAAAIALTAALPALGETYRYSYAAPCDQLWSAVKAALGNQQNYAKVKIDDEKMKGDYQPRHEVHFDVGGAILQRMNHVTLQPKSPGCEMDVVSNYSGLGHQD